MTPAASSGPAADYVKEIRVDVEGEFGRGPTGTCIREERPVVNDDFDINPSAAPWREPALHYGFRASAAFPLCRQGKVVSALTLYAAAPGAFDRDHVHLLEALCGDISYALDAMHQEQLRTEAEKALRASEEALRQANERLEEKIRERTAELVALNKNLMESRDQLRSLASDLIVTEARERRALALDLHDSVAQMLAIAKLTLESTGASLEGKSREAVKRVIQLLQEASRQTRSLMSDLSPSLLYEAGLEKALRSLARRMGELHSLTIAVVDDGNPKPLAEDSRVLLFRAVQELLHNVVKHAKATNVKVSLHREDKRVRIEVEDDGVGFLLAERRRGDGMRGGFGLFSIRERLQHLGGGFEVVSRPDQGTRVILLAPLKHRPISCG